MQISVKTSAKTQMIDITSLVLGTWQGIFFCEFDGPRNRRVNVKILADL